MGKQGVSGGRNGARRSSSRAERTRARQLAQHDGRTSKSLSDARGFVTSEGFCEVRLGSRSRDELSMAPEIVAWELMGAGRGEDLLPGG